MNEHAVASAHELLIREGGMHTSCSSFGNCTILDSVDYDPAYPVPYWHQHMGLATICICNSLTLFVIASRLVYRRRKFHTFKGDDIWMAVAGFFLIGLFVCQLGAVRFGSGLHLQNVPPYWRKSHSHFQTGFAGYYIVVSCIKLSVCFCFLQILTHNLKSLRYCVYGLCGVIGSLGIVCAVPWSFGCLPFLSKFRLGVYGEKCINYDVFRWLWISVSVAIDMVTMSVPLRILNKVQLRVYEKRILQSVFCATLIGTICCIVGIYGSFEIRTVEAEEIFYRETAFIMCTVIEIFAYALGASFPVLSRYIVAKVDRSPERADVNFSTWARCVPDFIQSPPRNIVCRSRLGGHCSPKRRAPLGARDSSSFSESHTLVNLVDQRSLPSFSKSDVQLDSALRHQNSSLSGSERNLDWEKLAARDWAQGADGRVRDDVAPERGDDRSPSQEDWKNSLSRCHTEVATETEREDDQFSSEKDPRDSQREQGQRPVDNDGMGACDGR